MKKDVQELNSHGCSPCPYCDGKNRFAVPCSLAAVTVITCPDCGYEHEITDTHAVDS